MRIRSIRPEFWHGEKVLALSYPARLLLIGLNNYCDDAGRGEWLPLTIRSFLAPDKPTKVVVRWLEELVEVGAIRKYAVDGKIYLDIPNWDMLQHPNHPQESKLPQFTEGSRIIHGTLPEGSLSLSRVGESRVEEGSPLFSGARPKKENQTERLCKTYSLSEPKAQAIARLVGVFNKWKPTDAGLGFFCKAIQSLEDARAVRLIEYVCENKEYNSPKNKDLTKFLADTRR